jgi:putative YhdH/YhfP family quinone oxidoreductase
MTTSFKAFRLAAGDPAPERQLIDLTPDDLSPGEVLIRVAYSSINYKDALASKGLNGIIRSWPRIGGIDLSGTVASSADARFKPGDEVVVHGFGIGVDHDGGHAQMARVSGDWVMPLPAGLSLLDAATIGAAGYTAGLSLHLMELNGLTPEQGPVLVTGATGGVASVAIDMFSQRGYQVTAMSGKAAEEPYLRQLGASTVIGRLAPEGQAKPLEKPNGPAPWTRWAATRWPGSPAPCSPAASSRHLAMRAARSWPPPCCLSSCAACA